MAFPQEVYQFQLRTEILASDVPYVQRFQELKLKANRTPEEETEMSNLMARLRSKFISSDDWNQFQNALVEMQLFLKNNVEGYIDNMVNEVDVAKDNALIAIDQKKNAIIVYLDSLEAGKLRNDIGVMAELTTTAKSSLVAAVNEVNSKAPTDASTTTKGITQLTSTASTSESLAATPKLVKDSTDTVSTSLTTHTNITTSVHGSTSSATANRIIQRDANGRAKIATPSASDDIARLDTVTGQVGTLSSLQTTVKTNVVSAINEVFQSGVSAKQGIVDAINAKDGSASTSETWATLASKVLSIQQGRYQLVSPNLGHLVDTVRAGQNQRVLRTIATFVGKTSLISIQPTAFNSYNVNGSMYLISSNYQYCGVALGLQDSNGLIWQLPASTGQGSSGFNYPLNIVISLAGKTSRCTYKSSENSSASISTAISTPPSGFRWDGDLSLIVYISTNVLTGSETASATSSFGSAEIYSM